MDRPPREEDGFHEVRKRIDPASSGSLQYQHLDVQDVNQVEQSMNEAASRHNRLDGLVAAAGIDQVENAFGYQPAQASDLMRINYNGVFCTAAAAARQMRRRKCKGSILLVAGIGDSTANADEYSAVYDSSKASIVQLTRCLAMEWGKADSHQPSGIRVNCLCPGHVVTPKANQIFEESPKTKEVWEQSNMLGRLSRPEEYRGAALFLLSDASSFMTGSSVVVDGGHTIR